jgi:hypothetical protein
MSFCGLKQAQQNLFQLCSGSKKSKLLFTYIYKYSIVLKDVYTKLGFPIIVKTKKTQKRYQIVQCITFIFQFKQLVR